MQTSTGRPLVSVIVPARNPRLDWFAAALESVFQESGVRIELIVVDDGSDPPLQPKVRVPTDGRLVVERIIAGGVSKARNHGLTVATGDYLRFVDADDLVEPGSTTAMVEASAGGRFVSYGETQLCDPQLNPTGRIASRMEGFVHENVAAGLFNVTLPACLIPRTVAQSIGGFDTELVVQEDWDFVLRATEVIPVRPIAKRVYWYRRYPDSHSSRPHARREAILATIRILRNYLQRHPEVAGQRAERKIRAYAQFLIARLREPRVPMRTRRFWRATAADPLRGLYILGNRSAALVLEWLRRSSGG